MGAIIYYNYMIDTQILKVEGEKEKESSRWDGEIQRYIGARGRTEIFLTITPTKYIHYLIHMYSTHFIFSSSTLALSAIYTCRK